MRDSEELALALYRAWARYEGDKNADEIEWDQIGEFQQQGYLDQVNAAFNWLFEHGRMSKFINAEQLQQAGEEYGAHLEGRS